MDETKAHSGVYLVSIAKKRSDKTKALEGEPTDKEEEGSAWKKEEPAEGIDEPAKTKERTDKKKFSITFPYHDRKVLFHANTFQEAIHLADALVEKMIKSKTLLAS